MGSNRDVGSTSRQEAVAPAVGNGAEANPPQTGENTCPACSGSGLIDGKPCGECGGTGKVTETVGDA